jgi:UDP-3-O-[3-hydroxymyristoyl] N-acetylglucosamine deacetylase/3-hydroxyacyl-[acyl-carrier-protein] dehydratase
MARERQRTIGEERALAGVGLHTGETARVALLPAEECRGVVFRRIDLDGRPEIPALSDRVVGTDRGTTLGVGEARVHTVEHLLSAVAGGGVDNLVVEIDGPEVPVVDGSARAFAGLLEEAGLREQRATARTFGVTEPFSLEVDGSRYEVLPAETYELSVHVEFPHPLIGRQSGSWRIDRESYRVEISPARTFGFVHEVEALRARGLALGGSVANAVVLDETGLVEGVELRFPDEFVRHKALDVVGDLALVGGRVRAHVVAERPGHRGNVALAREIQARGRSTERGEPMLNVQQIMEYLPHRYPFLLVDRVLDFEPGRRIVGLKNVTINEPFFNGHFPGNPIMPGVLIIEAMAQVGGLLVMDQMEERENKIVLFMSLDHVKWRRPVVPGDQIRFEVEILKIRRNIARMKGVGLVDGQVVAEAEMMASVVDR